MSIEMCKKLLLMIGLISMSFTIWAGEEVSSKKVVGVRDSSNSKFHGHLHGSWKMAGFECADPNDRIGKKLNKDLKMLWRNKDSRIQFYPGNKAETSHSQKKGPSTCKVTSEGSYKVSDQAIVFIDNLVSKKVQGCPNLSVGQKMSDRTYYKLIFSKGEPRLVIPFAECLNGSSAQVVYKKQ